MALSKSGSAPRSSLIFYQQSSGAAFQITCSWKIHHGWSLSVQQGKTPLKKAPVKIPDAMLLEEIPDRRALERLG